MSRARSSLPSSEPEIGGRMSLVKTESKRRKSVAQAPPLPQKGLGLGFKKYKMSVVKPIHEFGSSVYYLGKGRSLVKNNRSTKTDQNFLVRTTVVTTKWQSKRLQTEARALRRLSYHINILSMLDSGVSVLERNRSPRNGTEANLANPRLYCFLFEYCSGDSVRTLVEVQQRNQQSKSWSRRSLFAGNRLRESTVTGYLDISTVLGIFRQMVYAVSLLHKWNPSRMDSPSRTGIIHMDLRPEVFMIKKTGNEKGSQYVVKLCGLGCAIEGRLPLLTVEDHAKATELIGQMTCPSYRAPEMLDLHMAVELTDRVDVWALGCCLYELLFLQDCFQGHSPVFGSGRENEQAGSAPYYIIPPGHPFGNDAIELMSRMLAFTPKNRPSIQDVLDWVCNLEAGDSLPPRKIVSSVEGTESETSSEVDSSIGFEASDGAPWVAEETEDVGCSDEAETVKISNRDKESLRNSTVDSPSSLGNSHDAEDSVAIYHSSGDADAGNSDDDLALRVLGILGDEVSDTESSGANDIQLLMDLKWNDVDEDDKRGPDRDGNCGAKLAVKLMGETETSDCSSENDSLTDQDAGDGSPKAMLSTDDALLDIGSDSDSDSPFVYAASEELTSGSETDSFTPILPDQDSFLAIGDKLCDGIDSLDLDKGSDHSASWLEFEPWGGSQNNLKQRIGPLIPTTPTPMEMEGSRAEQAAVFVTPSPEQKSVSDHLETGQAMFDASSYSNKRRLKHSRKQNGQGREASDSNICSSPGSKVGKSGISLKTTPRRSNVSKGLHRDPTQTMIPLTAPLHPDAPLMIPIRQRSVPEIRPVEPSDLGRNSSPHCQVYTDGSEHQFEKNQVALPLLPTAAMAAFKQEQICDLSFGANSYSEEKHLSSSPLPREPSDDKTNAVRVSTPTVSKAWGSVRF